MPIVNRHTSLLLVSLPSVRVHRGHGALISVDICSRPPLLGRLVDSRTCGCSRVSIMRKAERAGPFGLDELTSRSSGPDTGPINRSHSIVCLMLALDQICVAR